MKLLARLLALVLVAFGLVANQAPASAATGTFATGLIVRYQPGYAALAPNGQFTGENVAGVDIVSARELGQDYVALKFASLVDSGIAARYAENLQRDPRVFSAELDLFLEAPAAAIGSIVPMQSAIKPASAPLGLKAVDAWSASTPTTAKVRLTWLAPKSLYSAKLAGYQIERSTNGGAWKVVTAAVSASVRTYTFSYPTEAGSTMKYRVRAITKVGAASKVGSPSLTATVKPTAAPRSPRLIGFFENYVNEPMWKLQSTSERGGLSTTYTVTAIPTNSQLAKVSCSTAAGSANSCLIDGLLLGNEYELSLVAKNSRGSAAAFKMVLPADEYFYQQWYLFGQYGINASKAWTQSRGKPQTVVAVLDTGITNHADFSGQLLPGQDFVSLNMGPNDGDGWDANPTDPGDYTSLNDNSISSWHGTHVAGLIGAATNTEGVSGVAPGAKILPVRIMGFNGGSQSDLVAGVNWAAGFEVPGAVPSVNPNPAKVINISMGTATPTSCGSMDAPTATLTAFQAAKAAGVTIITSAGNGDANYHPIEAYYSYPGNCFGSINVGATGSEGYAASYSNYGIAVDISAPGGDTGVGCTVLDSACKAQTEGTTGDSEGAIISTFDTGSKGPTGDTYLFDQGTSMAAPLVAGVVALLYSERPSITPDQVWATLQATVSPFKPGTLCATTAGNIQTQRCGVGIVDAYAAVAWVKSHY